MNLEPSAADSTTGGFHVGVEVSPAILRAGVFAADGMLKGKVKVSTKLERGPAVVMERVAKCVRYAVDECDLRMSDIASVGVAMPGQVDHDGVLVSSSAMGWERTDLAATLAVLLGRPVVCGQLYELSAMGIVAKEFAHVDATRVLVLFPNPQIGAAVLVDGFPTPLREWCDGAPDDRAVSENVVASVMHPVFGNFRGRDFRKALKKDPSGQLKGYALQLAARAGEAAAKLATKFSPGMIILGGALVDEVGGELLNAARTAYRTAGGADSPELKWEVSSLGDLAAITGAACLAQSRAVSLSAFGAGASLLQGSLPA
jgi:predicted NBD/HSP70 family sugar kinase